MTTVQHYIPKSKQIRICQKGGTHEGQGLNLVCLDPLCRQNSLACAVCFTETHKYHKVMSLHKFLDDYKRNIGSCNINMQQNKISKHYKDMQILLASFRSNVNRHLDQFHKSLQQYASYLFGSSCIRSQVGRQLGIQLDPKKITPASNLLQLSKSLKFILNNSLFDDNLNMIAVTGVLKQNQDRVLALLDKMVYMTEFCEKTIQQVFKSLKFASQTLKQQKKTLHQQIQRINDSNDDCLHYKSFMQKKNNLAHIISINDSLIFEQLQKIDHLNDWNSAQKNPATVYKFGKYKHEQIRLDNLDKTAVSNITALKPIYALAWPNLNIQPQQKTQWSIKINQCRDFSSENTMALGIGRLSDLKLAQFQGHPTNCLLISSQGFVVLNGKHEKTNFTYREGDTLNFKYDPYYEFLQVSKQNGKKLCLKALKYCPKQPLYICARLTYASDKIQML